MNDSDRAPSTMMGDTRENGTPNESTVIPNAPSRASAPSEAGIAEKVILLVDANPATRESRARAMESRGLNIHIAGSSGEAVSRFSSGAYDLVLIDLGHRDRAERLAQDLRLIRPRQRVAFLVGGPRYVLTSPVKRSVQRSSSVTTPTPDAVPFDFGQRVRDTEAHKG